MTAQEPAGGEDTEAPDLRPLTRIRRVVAKRMTQAAQTIPAVTIHRDASYAPLLQRRQELAVPPGRGPAIDALLAAIVARALVTHDLLNGSWVEEPPAVRVHPGRHIAIAVDTPQGLVAVVLRDADVQPIEELDRQLGEMVGRARAGKLSLEDVADATFTITNLGGLGVTAFTPIITPPQAAVLGIGAVARDGDRRGTLSLTFDHRIVDGADAARFLGDVIAGIERGG
jgi:pyruvate dehydrogenase E2 component (dihydrolipoamide acetyltransferase)